GLLIALLIHSMVIGQVCVVGSTEPPSKYSSGLPVAWPKTGLYSAPQYIGYVDWYAVCGYVVGVNGEYWSCLSPSLYSDVYQSVTNWGSAASYNGSSVQFNQTSQAPTSNTGSCNPVPCFPTWTPWIE